MNRDDVRKAFLELIKPYVRVQDPSSIADSSLLVDDLKLNSARFVDVILETEDRFKISVNDQEMERFERVGDAVDFIFERTVPA
jgi:acyl carrier protein